MWSLVFLIAVIAIVIGIISRSAERPIGTSVLGELHYDIEPIVAPTASGFKLQVLSRILCSDWLGHFVTRMLVSDNSMHLVRQLAAQTSEPAVQMPLVHLSHDEHAYHESAAKAAAEPTNLAQPGESFRGVLDFHEDYKAKVSTPTQEVQKALNAARAADIQFKCFVDILEKSAIEEAQQSTERWAKGQVLGLFDGVPFVVKDEVAVAGTILGDGLLRPGRKPESQDDLVVARLRAAGGVLIGKTVMTTHGMSPLGYNPHFHGPLNAYNMSHYSGGSSAGTATAVAAGVVPVGIGLDGGGSIRLPAAFSGALGLAPTFSRVPFSNKGASVYSVIKIGPIAADAASLAIVFSIIAQPQRGHHYFTMYGGEGPPPPHIAAFNEVKSLQGIRLGVFTPHFEDASPAMVRGCRAALKALEALGATVVEVQIPHLQALALAHSLTIGSEMGSIHDLDWWQYRQYYAPDSKISLGIFRAFSAKEYVAAMQLKGWALRWMKEQVFSKVDAYVSPAAGTTAPLLAKAVREYGQSNTGLVVEVMKFIFLANLLRHPGVVVPVDYEEGTSLPISLHLMGDHWSEATLLRLSHALQTVMHRRKPAKTFTD